MITIIGDPTDNSNWLIALYNNTHNVYYFTRNEIDYSMAIFVNNPHLLTLVALVTDILHVHYSFKI